VSRLVYYLYVGFAKIFPAEKILYAKSIVVVVVNVAEVEVDRLTELVSR